MSTIRQKAKADFLEDPEIKEVINDILYPYLSKREAVIAIQFGVPNDKQDEWTEAVAFASSLANYTTSKIGRFVKHRVEFRQQQAAEIFGMYEKVENSPHLEIFIDNLKIPYAATLWLPLLWFYL